jgi:hypothetical protein
MLQRASSSVSPKEPTVETSLDIKSRGVPHIDTSDHITVGLECS